MFSIVFKNLLIPTVSKDIVAINLANISFPEETLLNPLNNACIVNITILPNVIIILKTLDIVLPK